MALTELNLVGTFKKFDGDSPSVASVTVSLNQPLFNASEDIVIQPNSQVVSLDGDGHFTLPIVATDDTDTTPVGGTYSVTVTFDDGNKQVFTIFAPKAGGPGSNLDLMSVIQPGPPGTGAFYVPLSARGIAGGVASLDGSALVPLAQLPMLGAVGDVPGPLDGSGLVPTSQLPPLGSLATNLFGDGADGDVVLPAGVTTLVRSMAYHNLTIPAGATLDPNGFVVLCSGILSGAGTILTDGGNGGSAGSPGTAGGGSIMMSSGSFGATGTTGVGAAGIGSAGNASSSGDGGSGGAGVGGTGITVTDPFNGAKYQDLGILGFIVGMLADYANGGSGGASGAGDSSTNPGGGGGGGGGMLAIAAYTITFTGVITSKGGNGGTPVVGNCGGGGGGGGGFIWVFTTSPSATFTHSVAGGVAGLGSGSGSAGTAGAAGIYRFTVVV